MKFGSDCWDVCLQTFVKEIFVDLGCSFLIAEVLGPSPLIIPILIVRIS